MVAKITTGILKNRWTWYILGALILGFILWRLLRKKIYQAGIPDDQPVSNRELTAEEQAQAAKLAIALYNELKGWTAWIFGRSPEPYEALATASDRIFTGAYNYFNMNLAQGEGTLRTWMEKDWYYTKSRAGAAVLLILQKMDRLNLK